MQMMGTIRNAAVAGACQVARAYLNAYTLKGVGDMLKLEIDSERKTVRASVMLEGEREPLDVSVGAYSFLKNGEDGAVVLKEISTSRQWVNTLVENLYPEGLPVKLNGKTFAILSKTL